jgi:hypothetical protein
MGNGFLTSLGGLIGYSLAKEVWRLVPLCIMWCIWRERNAPLFEDVEISMIELRKFMLNTLHIWIVAHHILDVPSFVDFLNLFSSYSSSY